MSSIRKMGISTAVAITMATGTVALAAAPAQAAPSCNLSSSGSYGGWGYSNCSGVKQHQVKVLCEENSGNRYTAYGSWKASGVTSSARCHEYAWLVTVGVNYTV